MELGNDLDIVRSIELDRYKVRITLSNCKIKVHIGDLTVGRDYTKGNMQEIISNSDFGVLLEYVKILNKYNDLDVFTEKVKEKLLII